MKLDTLPLTDSNPQPLGTATEGGNEPLTAAEMDAIATMIKGIRPVPVHPVSKHRKGRQPARTPEQKARDKRRADRALQARKTSYLDTQAMLNAKLEAHRD